MVNQAFVPKLPLREPLIASQDGAFTEFTVTQRLPNLARRVIAENNFSSAINQGLEKLAEDLVSGRIETLSDDTGVDVNAWQKYLEPYQQERWVDVPWFFAETYFFRYILNLTNYFSPGEWHHLDPFSQQKQQGLTGTFDSTVELCQQLNKWLDNNVNLAKNSPVPALTGLLYFCLWGNRVDLSLWSAFEENRSQFDIQSQQAHILVDNTSQVIDLLINNSQKNSRTQVDFIIDNAGFELVCDLCLVDFLLASGLVNQVKLHLKPHPTFVSDATIADVDYTINYLATSGNEDVTNVAHRWQNYLKSERLLLVDNYFWTSPLPFWQLPPTLREELAASALMIVKGDANYRRLLGDRKWDFSTDINDIVCYLPVPMVALRTLKSEVAVGIPSQTVENVTKTDANWLTNGQWGLIQFVG